MQRPPSAAFVLSALALPTSNLFKRGHCIRGDISSSNFPHFDINPNSGEAEGHSAQTWVATNKIYIHANSASHIVLLVIPPRAAKLRLDDKGFLPNTVTWSIDFKPLI